MSEKKKISILLKGDGLSYESQIDDAMAGQVIALCLSFKENGDQSSAALKSIPASGHHVGQRESAAEYMNRHAPKRNPDKILVLASFLKVCHSKDFFQAGEIKTLFRDAGELMPANFTRDFNWAISNGWIAPDVLKKGNFYVTNTGRKVLDTGFPEDLLKKSRGKTNVRRKKGNSSDE